MIIIIKVKDTATLARIEDFEARLRSTLEAEYDDVIDSITSEKQ